MTQPLLYTELASWFHLLTRPEDYAEEAGIFTHILHDALPGARTLLELGSGGGNNAWHMKHHFEITLSDLSPQMLETSRRLNPGLEHIQGDMRSLRLQRAFDVVFLHDAVTYMTSQDDLLHALRTAYQHTRPGGVTLVVPDFTRETFRPETEVGGHDGEDVTPAQPGRGLRYLSWSYDPDPADSTYISDFAYLLREGEQVRCVYDRHIAGLFPQATWLALLQEAGFQPQALPYDHTEVEGLRDIFLGRR